MMQQRSVFLLTDYFPLGTQETFLETEIKAWGQYSNLDIIIVPILGGSEGRRSIPANCSTDDGVIKKLKFFQKYIFITFPKIFFNSFFWKEIIAYPSVLLRIQKLRRLVAVSVFSSVICRYLLKNFKQELNKPDTLVYSYWFYYSAYAAAIAKERGYPFKLISRAHRMDVYQNREETHFYIPFRRFSIWKNFDKIFPVSKEGYDYLQSNQSIPSAYLSVSYLGVENQTYVTKPSRQDELIIVSCSYLVPVKRVHLLIDGIAQFKKSHPQYSIKWFHIGDGELRESLINQAKAQFSVIDIAFEFLGNMDNQQVLEFYKTHDVDCFATTSASEGLPVSIMEALSFGIPILSTDVGGISEAVNDEVGHLLEVDFAQNDFEKGLMKMLAFKNEEQRQKIARWGNEKFSASRNYQRFLNQSLSL
jgi:glycosyltransferase involved in cell wall biosynthesis